MFLDRFSVAVRSIWSTPPASAKSRRASGSAEETIERELRNSVVSGCGFFDTLREAMLGYKLRRLRPRGILILAALEWARRAARRSNWQDAEQRYRLVLAMAPDESGYWVQFGHAFKAQFNSASARLAYLVALRCDPLNGAALHECVALGDLDGATRIICRALGHDRTTPSGLRAFHEWVEQEAIRDRTFEALLCSPTNDPQLFLDTYSVPPPPTQNPSIQVHFLLVDEGADISAARRGQESLLAQSHSSWKATVISSEEGSAGVRLAVFGSEGDRFDTAASFHLWHGDGGIVWSSSKPVPDLVLVAPLGAEFDRDALAWFVHHLVSSNSALILCDEVRTNMEGNATSLWLKPLADTDMLAAGVPFGAVAGIRIVAGAHHGTQTIDDSGNTVDLISDLLGRLIGRQPVGHLPRILVSAPETDGQRPERDLVRRAEILPGPHDDTSISIIIPTRDGLEDLSRCVASIEATASDCRRLEIIVVDNGSISSPMLRFLDEGRKEGKFVVIRQDCPFNWSYLNNRGIETSKGAILLFLNDDIEFLTAGWDTAVRLALADPEIGAVGARLLYPDGTVQHAGIVLRSGTVPEHDGRGAAGDDPGPLARWLTRRSAAAVTGAFLASRREHVLAISGFDEDFPIWFNDVDYCLRQRRAGRHILFEPRIVALHHESRTIGRVFTNESRRRSWEGAWQRMQGIWGTWLHYDPGCNPHFASWGPPFRYVSEPATDAANSWAVRSAGVDPWLISDSPL